MEVTGETCEERPGNGPLRGTGGGLAATGRLAGSLPPRMSSIGSMHLYLHTRMFLDMHIYKPCRHTLGRREHSGAIRK